MTKRSSETLGDMTLDIAPPSKRMKVVAMEESENKIGIFDKKTVKQYRPNQSKDNYDNYLIINRE